MAKPTVKTNHHTVCWSCVSTDIGGPTLRDGLARLSRPELESSHQKLIA